MYLSEVLLIPGDNFAIFKPNIQFVCLQCHHLLLQDHNPVEAFHNSLLGLDYLVARGVPATCTSEKNNFFVIENLKSLHHFHATVVILVWKINVQV